MPRLTKCQNKVLKYLFGNKVRDVVWTFAPPWRWVDHLWVSKTNTWKKVKSVRPYWTFEKMVFDMFEARYYQIKIFGLEISWIWEEN